MNPSANAPSLREPRAALKPPALVLLVLLALIAARPSLAQDLPTPPPPPSPISDFSALCDGVGDAFVVQGRPGEEDPEGTDITLYEVGRVGDGLVFDSLGTINTKVNAVGFYNNYLYGLLPGTSVLFQIGSDADIAETYILSDLPSGNYITGTVDSGTGDLYLNASNEPTIYVVSLAGASPELTRSFRVSGEATGLATADFAYVGGSLYGYDGGADALYQMDAVTGALTFLDVSPALPTGVSYGAVWADKVSRVLYLYANEPGEVYRIDLNANTSRVAGLAPNLGEEDQNDGAACADFASFDSQTSELPVELAAFDATLDGEEALLRWTTAGETNNAGFRVQHAAPGAGAFQNLGFVEGQGTTAQAHDYAFRTGRLSPGTHRFRLKQVDADGAVHFSPALEVAVALPERAHLSPAYPNPFNPETRFTLEVKETQAVRVEVFDALGRRVALLHEGVLEAGAARPFQFEAASLPSGVYLVRAQGEAFTQTRQVTLVK